RHQRHTGTRVEKPGHPLAPGQVDERVLPPERPVVVGHRPGQPMPQHDEDHTGYAIEVHREIPGGWRGILHERNGTCHVARRRLAHNGPMKQAHLAELEVGRLGLGAMGMSVAYAGAGSDDAESIRTVHRAIELGVTLIDTAEVYGPYANEELVARALQGRRDQVVLATKFGLISHAGRNGLD